MQSRVRLTKASVRPHEENRDEERKVLCHHLVYSKPWHKLLGSHAVFESHCVAFHSTKICTEGECEQDLLECADAFELKKHHEDFHQKNVFMQMWLPIRFQEGF